MVPKTPFIKSTGQLSKVNFEDLGSPDMDGPSGCSEMSPMPEEAHMVPPPSRVHAEDLGLPDMSGPARPSGAQEMEFVSITRCDCGGEPHPDYVREKADEVCRKIFKWIFWCPPLLWFYGFTTHLDWLVRLLSHGTARTVPYQWRRKATLYFMFVSIGYIWTSVVLTFTVHYGILHTIQHGEPGAENTT